MCDGSVWGRSFPSGLIDLIECEAHGCSGVLRSLNGGPHGCCFSVMDGSTRRI